MSVDTSADPDVQQRRTEANDLVVDIVEAVAAARDVDSMDLDISLAEKLDLDALATVCASASQHPETGLTLEFTVEGCTVTVGSDGEVTVS